MQLREIDRYIALGLSQGSIDQLSAFGDLLLSSKVNVSGIRDPLDIERFHFLDSLSLLTIADVSKAESIVDVGSGGGLPSIVLALAIPRLRVVAVESVKKKCDFIMKSAATLGIVNLQVECARAERFGRGPARETFSVGVIRAVGRLAVDAELTVPLIAVGGVFVAMKGAMSTEERIQGENALAILGAGETKAEAVVPFDGAENRWLYLAKKGKTTPYAYPRREGIPGKRPLGSKWEAQE